MLVNNSYIKEENTRGKNWNYWTKGDKSTSYQNLWNTAKSVMKERCIAFIIRQQKSMLYLRNPEEEEQTKLQQTEGKR